MHSLQAGADYYRPERSPDLRGVAMIQIILQNENNLYHINESKKRENTWCVVDCRTGDMIKSCYDRKSAVQRSHRICIKGERRICRISFEEKSAAQKPPGE